MPHFFARIFLTTSTALLLGACTVSSTRQLSPDHETAEPRHLPPPDASVVPPDSMQRQ